MGRLWADLIVMVRLDDLCKVFQRVIANFPEFSFEFKIHPFISLELFEGMFNGYRIPQNSVNLEKVDLVLTHWSTVCLNFTAKGLPTVLVNYSATFNLNERYMDQYSNITISLIELEKFGCSYMSSLNNEFPGILRKYIEINLGALIGKAGDELFL